MIDIIALFFLCKMNGKLAFKKGLKPGTWKLYTILAWLFTEFVGLLIGVSIWGFNKEKFFELIFISLASAFGGYLIVRAILEKKPDVIEDDINSIGVDDLQPPRELRK